MKVDLAKSIDTQKVGFLHPYLISLLAGFYTSVIHPPDFWNTSNTTEYVFPKSFFHFACLSGSISILRVSEFLNDLIHYLHPKAIPQLHKMATGWQALVFWSHDMTWKISFWDGKIFKGELLNLQGVWFRNKNLPPSEPARSGRPQKGSWAVRSAPEPQKGWWAVRSALEPQKDSRAVHSCPEPSAKVSSDLEVERSFSHQKKNLQSFQGKKQKLGEAVSTTQYYKTKHLWNQMDRAPPKKTWDAPYDMPQGHRFNLLIYILLSLDFSPKNPTPTPKNCVVSYGWQFGGWFCFFLREMSTNFMNSRSESPTLGYTNAMRWLENGPGLQMYVWLKMKIFQPAMLVYQRVTIPWKWSTGKVGKKNSQPVNRKATQNWNPKCYFW